MKMTIKVLCFGIIRDIIGSNSLKLEMNNGDSINSFKDLLLKEYKELNKFSNFSVAVNEEYVEDNYVLKENDTIALIPPVSGG